MGQEEGNFCQSWRIGKNGGNMGKKIYAVRSGRKTGLFDTWAECQKQVTGFSGAEYKSFATKAEALQFLEGTVSADGSFPDEDVAIAYVDGSFDKNSGDFSYGMVILYQGEELTFSQRMQDSELAQMHNVAGEIKGAEAAMRYADAHGIGKIIIYHDYEGIAKWCNGAWKANKEGTKAYRAYYESVRQKLQVEFVKVKGHSGDKYNDMADKLAKSALGL